MNKTGKIKTAVLCILSLPNLFFPIQVANDDYTMSFAALIFGTIAVLFYTKLTLNNKSKKLSKPEWNENIFKTNNRFSIYQFWSFFFISIGASMIIGSLIKFQSLNVFGLTSILFGIGILTGIFISLNVFRRS